MSSLSVVDRRQSPMPRAYQPKQLNNRHHEILRLSLLGFSNKEIAEKLDCTPATVSIALNSGLGRVHSSILRSEADGVAVEVAKRIREIAPKAIAIVSEIMEDAEVPSHTRLRAAQDLLDRAGFAPVKKVDMNSTNVSLTANDLDNLKEVALRRAMENGLVVDVTATSGQNLDGE